MEKIRLGYFLAATVFLTSALNANMALMNYCFNGFCVPQTLVVFVAVCVLNAIVEAALAWLALKNDSKLALQVFGINIVSFALTWGAVSPFLANFWHGNWEWALTLAGAESFAVAFEWLVIWQLNRKAISWKKALAFSIGANLASLATGFVLVIVLSSISPNG